MFSCEFCDYNTCYKSDLNRHFKTKKHLYNTYTTKNAYACSCGKRYIHRASLYNHQKKCETEKSVSERNTTLFPQNTTKNAYPDDTEYGVDLSEDLENATLGTPPDQVMTSSDPAGVTHDAVVALPPTMSVSFKGEETVSLEGEEIYVEGDVERESDGIFIEVVNVAGSVKAGDEEEEEAEEADGIPSGDNSTSTASLQRPGDLMNIVSALIGQNQKLQELIMEQARKSSEREERLIELATRPTTTTINNPRVNILNVLNSEYKEAMDMNQFLDSIEVSLEDIFYTRDKGYVQGMCNVFVKQIENMNINDRPIHCADRKRLKFFVKSDNKWLRDDDNKFIHQAMTDISQKHVKTLAEWKRLHPNWMDADDLRDEYIQITSAIIGENTPNKEEKARRAFAKNISASTEFRYSGKPPSV
jgi:hypothetical protein